MLRRLFLCLVAATSFLLAGAAGAAPPAVKVHGAYCPPTGCAGGASNAATQVAALGLTLGIVLQMGRRRRSRPA